MLPDNYSVRCNPDAKRFNPLNDKMPMNNQL